MNYTAISWIFTLSMGMAMLGLPRKWALGPLFLGFFLLPVSESLVVVGINLPTTRILILIGLLGLTFKSPSRAFKLNKIDKVVISWVVAAVMAHSLLWGSSAALINRMGYGLDVLGAYFLVRYLVRDSADVERAIIVLAAISIVIAVCMLIERETARNPFAIFGGVPEVPELRKGRLRCQGPFRHPIMAGVFGASIFPLCTALYFTASKKKALAVLGAAAASVIAITSASSGPLGAYLAGVLALLLWPIRESMRLIRWGFLCMIILLQMVMKADVWSLIGRISLVDGGTAYHREVILEAFIQRFSEWWLVGTRSTAHWAPRFLVPTDLTNQFVRVGVDGGLVTLGLFVAVIALCFGAAGRGSKRLDISRGTRRMAWAMGVGLFVHVVAFMGASYWDQTIYALYASLGLVSSLSSVPGDTPSARTVFPSAMEDTWGGIAAGSATKSVVEPA